MNKAFMLGAGAAALLLASCGTTAGNNVPPLYNWDEYDNATYGYIKEGNEDSYEYLLSVYDKVIAEEQIPYTFTDSTTGEVIELTRDRHAPPGVLADYGYILIRAGKIEEGRAMLEKEKELYPVSAPYIDSILKKIKGAQ